MLKVFNAVVDVIAVIIFAKLIVVIIVVFALLAIYGDLTGKRNRWTRLNLPVQKDGS